MNHNLRFMTANAAFPAANARDSDLTGVLKKSYYYRSSTKKTGSTALGKGERGLKAPAASGWSLTAHPIPADR
jgi:hypothetical protein